ncbi:MAG TPA: TonB-dependent receptor [Kofleriaceae bacterium]|nr:TonB-dependent receptor [Kofleriaceae bacterium]
MAGGLAGIALACAAHAAFAQSPPDGGVPPDAPPPDASPAANDGSGSGSGSAAPASGSGSGSAAEPTGSSSGSGSNSRAPSIPTPREAAAEVIEIHGLAPAPTGSLLEPEPIAASDTSIDAPQLSLRPHRRAEDLTQEVPGLFTVQHAGGGKAQQYFMRGFDLDHGTDLAGFIDGVPINAVSHAHGQGFLDLHFIIPEAIDSLEATKGPYSARVGDFATAGSMSFHLADHVDDNIARLEYGTDGHERAVVVDSPDLGPKWRGVIAAEVFKEDGPFIHSEDYVRMNSSIKVTRTFDDTSELSLSAMGYSGTWNMSGVLPARAVCGEGDGTPVPALYAGSHCISRWDSIDPSQGGVSQRFMELADYRKPIPRGDIELSAYSVQSSLQLYPNDGIAASFQPAGMQYGSEVEQDDGRIESGVNARVTQNYTLLDAPLRQTFGVQVRHDIIASQLHRDEDRVRLDGMPGIPGPIVDSGITETESGAYVEEDWKPTRWLRTILGGRADRVDADVNNESPTAVYQINGYRGQSQFSPKASVVATPEQHVDLFANFGQGFHSNDIRTVFVGGQTTLLARATGGELGTTIRPIPGMSVSTVGFLLDLTSEETIDGDTASTDPSGPTRRYGAEITARYQYQNRLYAEGTYTYAHSRYTDEADIQAGAAYVALAPVHTLSAEVGGFQPIGGGYTFVGSLNVRAMSDRAGIEDNSLTATGFTLFNGLVGVRWKYWDASLVVLNIANTNWREGQFSVNSRLPGEGPNPPVGMSFTPGNPREILLQLSARFH